VGERQRQRHREGDDRGGNVTARPCRQPGQVANSSSPDVCDAGLASGPVTKREKCHRDVAAAHVRSPRRVSLDISLRAYSIIDCRTFVPALESWHVFDWMSSPEGWIALVTLTVLEIVLGVDNIIFISILAGKLKPEEQNKARRLGLLLAMLMRIALLFSIAWVTRLTTPLFDVLGHGVSGRDLVLILGGLFLLGKSTHEIHENLEGEGEHGAAKAAASLASVLVQIMLLDIVFSLDSVITAIGMADHLTIMVAAVVTAVGVMMVAARPIGEFVERHPTVKMLALSFLLLIGMSLILDGVGQHVPKGYVYFAMGFSVFVEMINLRVRSKGQPVELRRRYAGPERREAQRGGTA
jgi:predicted tellurium resistance membrane protein TerC